MPKSIKLQDDTYIDSTGIVHNRALLSAVLEKMVPNNDALKGVDIDTINKTCYNYCNECINIPTSTNGYLFTHRYRDDYIYQKYTTISGSSYERVKNAGVWKNWIKTSPIDVMETLTNENGTAVKFSDGTMICEGSYDTGSTKFNTAYGSIYYDGIQHEITYPVAFVGIPIVTLTAYLQGGIGGASLSDIPDLDKFCCFMYSQISHTFNNTGRIFWKAIGYWK